MAVYPVLACEATAHRHAVAARCLRLHATGPRTGCDGAAAPRPLRQPQRLLLASPRSISLWSATAASSVVTPIKIAARIARMVVPPLVGVGQVDSRWDPTARTRHVAWRDGGVSGAGQREANDDVLCWMVRRVLRRC